MWEVLHIYEINKFIVEVGTGAGDTPSASTLHLPETIA